MSGRDGSWGDWSGGGDDPFRRAYGDGAPGSGAQGGPERGGWDMHGWDQREQGYEADGRQGYDAGYEQAYDPGYEHGREGYGDPFGDYRGGRDSGGGVLGWVLGAVAVLLLVALVGLGVYLFQQNARTDETTNTARHTATRTVAPAPAGPASQSGAAPAPSSGSGQGDGRGTGDTGAEPETPGSSARPASSSSAKPTQDSRSDYPSGADRSGWTNDSAARCNAGDPAYMIGATSSAAFSICQNPDNGRYYYRGSSGAGGIEISDPTLSGSRATVTNNGHTYAISSSRMTISNSSGVIFDEPMVSFWTR